MNQRCGENDPPQRKPAACANPADMPLVSWIRRLNVRDRIGLKKRLAERALLLEGDPHFVHRVDREESARAAALFLEFARDYRLSPGEVDSLLCRTAHDATRALDELDGPARAKPTHTPGRDASGGASSRAGTTSLSPPSGRLDGPRGK